MDGVVDPGRVVVVGLLGLARLLPIFVLAPFFGGRVVPLAVRVALALAFVAVLYPALDVAFPPVASVGLAAVVALAAKELAIGLVLGFLVSLPFHAAEAAGRLADTARGANLGEVLVPQTGASSSPLGAFSLQLAVVVFFGLDGHLLFLGALGASYEAVPLAGFPPEAAFRAAGDLAIDATAQMVLAALGLAAPVLAALFLADLVLGLVNRVSPQVPVFFLGMPAKAVVGVLVFLLALGGIALGIRGELAGALANVRAVF